MKESCYSQGIVPFSFEGFSQKAFPPLENVIGLR